jgi:hypothetical protein
MYPGLPGWWSGLDLNRRDPSQRSFLDVRLILITASVRMKLGKPSLGEEYRRRVSKLIEGVVSTSRTCSGPLDEEARPFIA